MFRHISTDAVMWIMHEGVYCQWLACRLSALVIPASFTPVNSKIAIMPTLQRYLLATKAVRFATFAKGEWNALYLPQKHKELNRGFALHNTFTNKLLFLDGGR